MIVWCEHHYLITRGMTVHLTERRLTWNWIWGDLEWFVEWTDLHSLDWLDGRYKAEFYSLWLLGSVWTMWLGCLLLSPRLLLSLRGFHRPFTLWTFLAAFCLAPWAMVKDTVWTCWQMPSICHTWLPSYNIPPRGGQQLFWYSCLAEDTRGRRTSTPYWQKNKGA